MGMEEVYKMKKKNDIPSSDMLPDFFLLSASFSPGKEGADSHYVTGRSNATYTGHYTYEHWPFRRVYIATCYDQ
jgi:hypothetical protein